MDSVDKKYCYSNIPWIGEIPEDWTLPKVGYLTIKVGSGKTPNGGSDVYVDEGVMFLRSQNIYDEGLSIENVSFISTDIDYDMRNTQVQKGDVLLNITGGSIGRCCIFDLENTPANVNQHVCIIRVNQDLVSNGYMRYFWASGAGKAIIDYAQTGGNREGLNFEQIKNARIPIPQRVEQDLVVTHIDRETIQIDRLIADKQKLIELLKEQRQSIISEAVTKGLGASVPMKDSGIEWIGKIPSHWNVTRGKNILHLMKRPPADDCEVVTCFRDGEVTRRSNRREDGFTFADKEIGYQGIEVGDLVIHGMDGFAGSIGISDSSGKGSPVLCVCRAKKSGVESFYMYYLRALAVQDVFLALSTGIRERSCDLRWNKISTLLFPIPPENEQVAIVKHIGDKMAQIDAVIQQCNDQIALLKEYRQSIISEAVTGKYIVPAVDAPTEAKPERQANIHFKRRVLAAKNP